jgi:hypothetical protein
MSISLTQPPVGSTNWGDNVNANWQLIQNILNSPYERNKIINGKFDIWQRGTTIFSPITNGLYFADRWQYQQAGSMSLNATRDPSVPTIAQANIQCNYSAKLATNGTTTPGTTDYSIFTQSIEGYNAVKLIQQAFTISFWAKCSTTGTYSVSLRNDGTGGLYSYVSTFTVSSADTWAQYTINVPATSLGGWNTTNGVGLQFVITLTANTSGTYTTSSLNTWISGNYIAANTQSNFFSAASNSMYITLVQIEPGTVATNFEHETYERTIQKCQRYYCKSYPIDTVPGTSAVSGYCILTAWYLTIAKGYITFPVEMRTTPTVSVWSYVGTPSTLSNANGTNVAIIGGDTASEITARSFVSVSDSHNQLGLQNTTLYSCHYAANAEF